MRNNWPYALSTGFQVECDFHHSSQTSEIVARTSAYRRGAPAIEREKGCDSEHIACDELTWVGIVIYCESRWRKSEEIFSAFVLGVNANGLVLVGVCVISQVCMARFLI